MRSDEETERRIAIFERLHLTLDGEPLDLAIEALTDLLAMAIISIADDRLAAMRVVEAVSGALPRRIDQQWNAAKGAPATVPGSETIQ